MRRKQFITGLALIGLSASLLLLTGVFLGGFKETPYGTVDSNGFSFGFNNRITLELYGMIISNSSIKGTIQEWGWLGSLVFLAHLAGAAILVATRRRERSIVRNAFFLTQLVFLPAAIPGLLAGLLIGPSIVSGTADGETFIDLPVLWVPVSAWVFAGFVICCLGWAADSTISRQANGWLSKSPNF